MSNKLSLIPHPDKVLVRISKDSWDELFTKRIIRYDGKEIDLLTRIEAEKGYEDRFAQNVSVGHIIAVGVNVENVFTSDLAILDYIASNNDDITVGYFNGDKLISFLAKTTYHEKDAKPNQDGRRAYVKGDYDTVSPLLGIVREKKVIAFAPYVFMAHKDNLIVKVSTSGLISEEKEIIASRIVLAGPEDSDYREGDEVIVKEEDIFSRQVESKEMNLVFKPDVLYKKVKNES